MSDNPFENNPPPVAPAPTPPPVMPTAEKLINGTTSDERTMVILAYLLGIPFGILAPLIIWLIKKDQSAYVNDQGREVVNFHLTLLLCSFLFFFAMIIPFINCLAFIVLAAISVASIIFCVLGAIKASEGVLYRYPLNFRLIK